jgi:hypothetical protein
MSAEWQEIFRFYSEDRNRQYVMERMSDSLCNMTLEMDVNEKERWRRIEYELKERKIAIRHAHSSYRVKHVEEKSPFIEIEYDAAIKWNLEHFHQEYEQEWVESRKCILKQDQGWWVISDTVQSTEGTDISRHEMPGDSIFDIRNPNERRQTYQRAKAVEYAERWWNDYNPQFKAFDVDCTNYVSQCMWAGNAPMKYSSDRAKGWWYRFDPVNWSFSWSVANALRWYLPNSRSGLRAVEVFSADQLNEGDIICYDFNGDGRWQHNTIVVTKDAAGMPLVNAHTTNSRHRYWSYKDSYAWTEKTQYKFFRIKDDF